VAIRSTSPLCGQLLHAVFLADYFVNDAFRRELLRVLNRGESVNTLKRAMGIKRSHEAGFARHLTKPFDIENLDRVIQEFRARRQGTM